MVQCLQFEGNFDIIVELKGEKLFQTVLNVKSRLILILMVVVLIANSSNAYIIDNGDITASASSSLLGHDPNRTLGPGLNGNLHNHDANDMWFSNNTTSAWLEYDLGKVHSLTIVEVWGIWAYGWDGVGSKNINVKYKKFVGDSWTSLGSYILGRGFGIGPDYHTEDIINFGAVDVQFVLIEIIDCWDGTVCGIAEIRFHAAPEPTINFKSFLDSSEGTTDVWVIRGGGYSEYFVSDEDLGVDMPISDLHTVVSEINDIGGTPIRAGRDLRPLDSNSSYNLSFIYNGSVSVPKENHLKFLHIIVGPNEPVIFQQTSSTNPSAFYPVYDIKRAFAQNAGIVPLIDLETGSYNTSTPFATGILDVGTRFLGDISYSKFSSDSGHVDLGDFALLSLDWGKGPGQYLGDIAGPNGIPDGYVNHYDLSAYCDDYLKDVNDF